jgi:anti-sigma B factor antagonist
MQYTIDEHRRVALIVIEEEALGAYNADEFAAVLQDPLDKGYKNIVIDLSGVVRLQTRAIGVLIESLKHAREKGGDIQLCNPSDKVIEVLNIAGLLPIFTIHADQVAAVGSF